MKKIFTVEFDPEERKVELHLNDLGVNELIDSLKQLQNGKQNDHTHLMTENWGGQALSNEQQNIDTKIELINHLKLFYWKE
jgi:hypothetical protein